MDFCVYIYKDDQGKPYYVGSGVRKRPYQAQGHPPLPSSLSRIRVLLRATRQEARALESLLIEKWGCKADGGLLDNKPPGNGRGKGARWHRPAEHRARRDGSPVPQFCVYIYRDSGKRPYYVGSGSRYRPFSSGSRGAPRPDDAGQIRVKYCCSKEESLALEELLIAKWGRRSDGGWLMNKSRGGSGPKGVQRSGQRMSDLARERMSLAKRGWSPSPELRALASTVHRGRIKSEEERRNISKALRESPKARAQLAAMQQSKIRRVWWVSPDGELVFAAQKELVARDSQLQQGSLSAVMNGRRAHHKGWRLANTLSAAA